MNEAKKILADEATSLCHGKEAANQARKTAEETFESGGASDNLPCLRLGHDDFTDGQIGLLQLVVKAGFAKSNGEARRLVEQHAIKINQEKISDVKTYFKKSHFHSKQALLLSFGQKKHIQILMD